MKMYFALLSCLLFSTASFAGVAEKKAERALSDNLEEAVVQIKNDCANAALGKDLKVDEKFTAQDIKIAGENAKDFLKGIIKACEDADYKAEIGKINQINFSLTDNEKSSGSKTKIYGEISVANNAMNVALHTKRSLANGSSDTVVKAIKELY